MLNIIDNSTNNLASARRPRPFAIVIALIILFSSLFAWSQYSNNKEYNKYLGLAEEQIVQDKLDEAAKNYQIALQYKWNDGVQAKLDLTNKLIASKASFNTGNESYDQKEYMLAISRFKQVIPDDSTRYNLAQAKLVESIHLYTGEKFTLGSESYNQKDYTGAVQAMKLILLVDEQNLQAKELLKKYVHALNEKQRADREVENKRLAAIREAANREAAAQEAAAKAKAKSEGVRIGMTQEQVLASSWGRPQKVNKTTTAYGVHEQWVYSGYNYLYFEDGILRTIQN